MFQLVSYLPRSYRYGFNGMEKDNEIKGAGNSYDFGARMLDPRLGRWLTIDPLAGKQPDQSPYKSMLNNPIIWSDPNGETEFFTVIIKNEKTGSFVKLSIPVSGDIMTDGVKHSHYSGRFWDNTTHTNAYYDFSRVMTITLDANNKTSVTFDTKILTNRGIKDEEYIWIDGEEKGHTKLYRDGYQMGGGFYMTGSGGQGTKYYSKSTPKFIGNIVDLMSIMTKYKVSGKIQYQKN